MATVPSISNPTTATVPSTTTFGVPVVGGINFGLGIEVNVRPYAFAYDSVGRTIPGSLSFTLVQLDSEVKDTDGIHGTTGTFTVVTAGLYLVTAQVFWPSTASGQDVVQITKNGTSVGQSHMSNIAASHKQQATAWVQCVATDTIQLFAASTSGGTLAGTTTGGTWLTAMWMQT